MGLRERERLRSEELYYTPNENELLLEYICHGEHLGHQRVVTYML